MLDFQKVNLKIEYLNSRFALKTVTHGLESSVPERHPTVEINTNDETMLVK